MKKYIHNLFKAKCLFAIALSSALISCASMNTSANVRSKFPPRTEKNGIINVYVPGVLGSTKQDPLLNPFIPGPGYSEDNFLTQNCTVGRLGDVSSIKGRFFIKKEKFDSLMKYGFEAAKIRHQWRFQVDRANAQNARMESIRTRLGPAGLERLKMQRQIYLDEADKPLRQRSVLAQVNSPHSNPEIMMPEIQEDIEKNLQTLRVQEQSIKEQEREYSLQMLSLYEEAFIEFSSVASINSIQLLNRYERLRQNNLLNCMRRFTLSDIEKHRIQSIDSQVRVLAKSILNFNRSSISKRMSEVSLVSDKMKVYEEIFSSSLLQELAQDNLGISPPDGSKIRQPGPKRLMLN